MDLRAQQERGYFDLSPIEYGRSVFGAPLLYFPSAQVTPETGLIIAGTHGDEVSSITALSCALRSISASQLSHHVVLSVNPDGNQLGTRANARGVDLNRNFDTKNWQANGTVFRWNTQAPERDVRIGTGECGNSEPETAALCRLIKQLSPAWVVSFHDPLACVDDPENSELGQYLSHQFDLPLVKDVGYATPGSFGSWCAENDLLAVTVELPPISTDLASETYLTPLIELLIQAKPKL